MHMRKFNSLISFLKVVGSKALPIQQVNYKYISHVIKVNNKILL